MFKHIIKIPLSLTLIVAVNAFAETESFTLKSNDIYNGQYMNKAHEFNGFGCTGDNISPQLSWSGAPNGTAAYAILVHDADAPTGSGWWHWQVVNIPNTINNLSAGAGAPSNKRLPNAITNIKNDYGSIGYGGACPPIAHGTHHYKFTIYALSQKLNLPDDASGALTGYMVRANSIASSTIEALYKRE